MDLIKHREGQDLPDPGDRSQAVKGIAVMLLGLAHDRQLEVGDEIVVAQGEASSACSRRRLAPS
jgi:hypothetical protein